MRPADDDRASFATRENRRTRDRLFLRAVRQAATPAEVYAVWTALPRPLPAWMHAALVRALVRVTK